MGLFKSSKDKGEKEAPPSNGAANEAVPPVYAHVADGHVPTSETIPVETKPQAPADYQPPSGPPPGAAPHYQAPPRAPTRCSSGD